MVLRSDGCSRANIEVGKDQVVKGGAWIDFYVTSQEEEKDEELAGDMIGKFKFPRRHG